MSLPAVFSSFEESVAMEADIDAAVIRMEILLASRAVFTLAKAFGENPAIASICAKGDHEGWFFMDTRFKREHLLKLTKKHFTDKGLPTPEVPPEDPVLGCPVLDYYSFTEKIEQGGEPNGYGLSDKGTAASAFKDAKGEFFGEISECSSPLDEAIGNFRRDVPRLFFKMDDIAITNEPDPIALSVICRTNDAYPGFCSMMEAAAISKLVPPSKKQGKNNTP